MIDPNELPDISEAMLERGVAALLEEGFATPQAELVSLIYMAMECQRIRDSASATMARK